MSDEPTEDELEKLRQQKMEQMQQRQQGGEQGQREAQEAQRQQAEAQKEAMLKQHLTDGARKRLNTVKMSKPEAAEKVEQQVLAIAQSGRLGDQRIDEDQMKELLQELTPDSKSFNIRRR